MTLWLRHLARIASTRNLHLGGWVIVLALAEAGSVRGAVVLPADRSLVSTSKQFIVSSSVARPSPNTFAPVHSATNIITLTPGRVVILAERIKTLYLRLLGTTDQWSGQIRLHLAPAGPAPGTPEFQRTLYQDGWQYQVTLPERMPAMDAIRVMVDVLLEETAQRYSRRATEIPLWLRVGMAEMIWASDGAALTSPSNVPVVFDTLHPDPFGEARTLLQVHLPYTFGDLSLPTRRQLAGEGWPVFRACAHVLTAELLLRPDGPAQLREFLRQLPRYRNSELAFLTAYRFENMLAVEKWWTVVHSQFRSRDRFRRWSTPLSIKRLEEVLMIESLKAARPQRLQHVVGELKLGEQKSRLGQVLFQLRALQANAPPALVKLINDYHDAILTYHQQRGLDSLSPAAALESSVEDIILTNLRSQLDRLDTILVDLSLVGESTPALGKTAAADPSPVRSPFALPAGLPQLP